MHVYVYVFVIDPSCCDSIIMIVIGNVQVCDQASTHSSAALLSPGRD
jgi:hypothetical protein